MYLPNFKIMNISESSSVDIWGPNGEKCNWKGVKIRTVGTSTHFIFEIGTHLK